MLYMDLLNRNLQQEIKIKYKNERTYCSAFMVFGRFAILTARLELS